MELVHQEKSSLHKEWSIIELRITSPCDMPRQEMYIGIDPGTSRLGIAQCINGFIHAYQIHIERKPTSIERMLEMEHVLRHIINPIGYNPVMIIEGASVGYRLSELAEVRAACYYWGRLWDFKTQIVHPSTIRKMVFGNYKLKAHEMWPDLEKFPDAAAALSCVLYGAGVVYN